MKKKYVIVGLRAIHPTIVGANLPGYLGSATEHHRKGIHLQDVPRYVAFYPDPMNEDVFLFDNEVDCMPLIEELIKFDPGWFRPLTCLPIYL